MASSSKILTVSYGTFSCTAEGFEDPLGAVKDATHFFRGIVNEDRFFGAEPPQLDSEMAAELLKQQITAENTGSGLSLRPALTAGAASSGALAAALAAGPARAHPVYPQAMHDLPDDDTIEAVAREAEVAEDDVLEVEEPAGDAKELVSEEVAAPESAEEDLPEAMQVPKAERPVLDDIAPEIKAVDADARSAIAEDTAADPALPPEDAVAEATDDAAPVADPVMVAEGFAADMTVSEEKADEASEDDDAAPALAAIDASPLPEEETARPSPVGHAQVDNDADETVDPAPGRPEEEAIASDEAPTEDDFGLDAMLAEAGAQDDAPLSAEDAPAPRPAEPDSVAAKLARIRSVVSGNAAPADDNAEDDSADAFDSDALSAVLGGFGGEPATKAEPAAETPAPDSAAEAPGDFEDTIAGMLSAEAALVEESSAENAIGDSWDDAEDGIAEDGPAEDSAAEDISEDVAGSNLLAEEWDDDPDDMDASDARAPLRAVARQTSVDDEAEAVDDDTLWDEDDAPARSEADRDDEWAALSEADWDDDAPTDRADLEDLEDLEDLDADDAGEAAAAQDMEDDMETGDLAGHDADADKSLPVAAEADTPPEPTSALTGLRARVIKVKRAVFDNAVASGKLEEVVEDDTPAPAPEPAESSLTAEEEDELARELAAVKAELAGDFDDDDWDDDEDDALAKDHAPADATASDDDWDDQWDDDAIAAVAEAAAPEDDEDAEDTAVADDDWDDDWDDEDEELAEANNAPLRLDNPIAQPGDATDDAADESAPGDPEALAAATMDGARKAVKMANPGRAMLTEGKVEDNDTSRLLNQTNEEMEEPEGNRRRSAIAHLRAAVAATKADRLLGGRKPDAEEEAEPYREDLATVVRPRRPQPSKRTERPVTDARPAPLKLVAEQRIAEGAPSAPVRPRRISRAALADAASPTRRASSSLGESAAEGEDGQGFAAYAENVGAKELSDLLEAAASYMSFVEGRDQFSRPQLMTTMRLAETSESSREDRLRSFGKLLREGKIEKTSGGRFTASDRISFKPGRRAAG